MFLAAAIGLIGVIFVAKPDAGMFNQMSVIGLGASFLAAMAFVTVRALTSTESPEKNRVLFLLDRHTYFHGSNVLAMATLSWTELGFLICAGLLANISQIFYVECL